MIHYPRHDVNDDDDDDNDEDGVIISGQL